MIQELHDVVGLDEVVRRCEAVLSEAAALGLPRHAASRFEQYLGLLKEAAAFTYPRTFPWKDDAEKQREFFEAASQVQQLIDAQAVWNSLAPPLLKNKLKTILGGTVLPPKDKKKHDPARNILFEFVVARALQHKGFAVELTDSDEDVRATFPGLPPFLVECKRPTNLHSLEEKVKRSRRQLWQRCDGSTLLGMPVFGIDRLFGLSQATPNAPTLIELQDAIEQVLRQHKELVQRAERATGKQFFPNAPVAGVLLATAVFPWDRGGIYSVSQLRLFCTGSDLLPISRRIMAALSATIKMTA